MTLQIEDYLQNAISDEVGGAGEYRCFPVDWTFKTFDSGSAAIAYKLSIVSRWHGKEQGWSKQWGPGFWVEHNAWVVKSDGTLNDKTVKRLIECGLWDGDFEKIQPGQNVPNQVVIATVQVATNKDGTVRMYQGQPQFEASWVDANADAPPAKGGGYQPSDPSALASMRAKFGPAIRAIAGGGQANGAAPAPPAVAPPVVPPAPQVPQAQAAPEAASAPAQQPQAAPQAQPPQQAAPGAPTAAAPQGVTPPPQGEDPEPSPDLATPF